MYSFGFSEVRDRNSYFYHQMLFLGVILLSTVSKMSNYMVKTSKFCLGPILLDSAPLNYLKSLLPKLYSKLPLTSSFLYFPLVCRVFHHNNSCYPQFWKSHLSTRNVLWGTDVLQNFLFWKAICAWFLFFSIIKVSLCNPRHGRKW